jgi:hypothetical protein
LTRFRVELECEGLPESAGSQAAVDIAGEFTHCPWHHNVRCTWNGRALRLEAENDFDDQGLALLDEFSDAIVACIEDAQFGGLRVVEVTREDE